MTTNDVPALHRHAFRGIAFAGTLMLAGCATSVVASSPTGASGTVPTAAGATATGIPSWTIVSGLAVPPQYASTLDSVACASTSDCWTVGLVLANGVPTLVAHNSGSGWVASRAAGPDGALHGVTCVSTSDCWAVGDKIEHFNGSDWTVVTDPDTGASLYGGITCVSASDCWAAGVDHGKHVFEHYNGTAWTLASNAAPAAGGGIFGIACATASDCWGVGWNGEQTLVEHNGGTGWVAAKAPVAGGVLNGVSCISTTDCWAVGETAPVDQSALGQSIFEHYNGSAWAAVVGPTFTTAYVQLHSVSCVSSTDCWAVGSAGGRPLIEQYTASGWVVVASSSAPNSAVLNSVTCVATSECWAVGSNGQQPLIEHYS
jgi:hypothetical protein